MELAEALRPSWMEVDLAALAHNCRALRRHLGPDVRIIAALKANGYGHGAGATARCLQRAGAAMVATGNFEDARAIRDAGVELPVLMFAGPIGPSGMGHLLAHDITPTVHDWTSALDVSNAATQAKRVAAAFVKVDCGMGRLGVPVAEAREFVAKLTSLGNLELAGVYTHLTFHDAVGREWARERYASFDGLLADLERAGIQVPVSQALASSSLMAGLESRANAVCPGHLLYGVSPVSDEMAALGDLRPVLSAIKSRIIHIGSSDEKGRWGVIPLGLADGYQAPVMERKPYALIAGRRVPIAGVSLEYLNLDLSGLAGAVIGDEVVLLGRSGDDEIALADLAQWQDTGLHNVLMALDRRLPVRHLADDTAPQSDA